MAYYNMILSFNLILLIIQKKENFMNNAAKFIITALLIVAGVLAYKTYQEGGFDDVKGINAPVEVDVESH
jgi:hypothetical protein